MSNLLDVDASTNLQLFAINVGNVDEVIEEVLSLPKFHSFMDTDQIFELTFREDDFGYK